MTLPSGLRVVYRRDPGARVDYCGVMAAVGSRDDDPDTPGMAHFVEHTIFKGTARRSAWHILNRMERIGGELNAYTTKEETVVYCAAPASHHLRAIELIADLVCNSRFPERELCKERDVVADEIDSYLDSPADAIIDDFEDLVFADTPLGHNILGTKEALTRFTSDRCRRYLAKWYTRSNIVLFYCGAASRDRIAAAAERCFAALPAGDCNSTPSESISSATTPSLTTSSGTLPSAATPSAVRPTAVLSAPAFDVRRKLDLHQAHVAMGATVPSMKSPERYTYSLLNNIIGGPGMNSLLNLDLREHRGLVYTVESNLGLLTDTGLMLIYFGCDPDDAPKCRRLVSARLADLAATSMSERYVAAAKKQYIGQLAVASDNRESTIISAARAALVFGAVSPSEVLLDHINAVTPEMLRDAAATVATPSVLTFAP